MQGSLEELVSVLDRLTARLESLECRVSALENRVPLRVDAKPLLVPIPEVHPLAQVASGRSAGIMPNIGKVVLAMGGAFVLRALAESGRLPNWAIVPIALTYAGIWLYLSARVHRDSRYASIAYSSAAALILSPMLWELTLRFRILPPLATAGILAGFGTAAVFLSWRNNLAEVAWPATVSVCITALFLMVATHQPAGFVCVLLLMAGLAEAAYGHQRWPYLQSAVAVAADLAILILIIVYTNPYDVSPDYQPIATARMAMLMGGLFAISAVGLVTRTLLFSREIRVFDICQTTFAFVLALVGVLRVSDYAFLGVLGTVCLLLAFGCYGIALTGSRLKSPDRRFYIFATWAALLLIMAAYLSFGPGLRVLAMGAAAVVATYAGSRWRNNFLVLQGAVFLVVTMQASRLLTEAGRAFMGEINGWPAIPVLISSALVVVCYLIASRIEGGQMQSKALRFTFAALAAYVASALMVGTATLAFAGRVAHETATPIPAMAVVRTLVLCVLALAVAVRGAWLERSELVWLAYAAMAACTLKLLLEDLRAGSAMSIAMSLFFYGAVWVLLPRLFRTRARARATHAS